MWDLNLVKVSLGMKSSNLATYFLLSLIFVALIDLKLAHVIRFISNIVGNALTGLGDNGFVHA